MVVLMGALTNSCRESTDGVLGLADSKAEWLQGRMAATIKARTCGAFLMGPCLPSPERKPMGADTARRQGAFSFLSFNAGAPHVAAVRRQTTIFLSRPWTPLRRDRVEPSTIAGNLAQGLLSLGSCRQLASFSEQLLSEFLQVAKVHGSLVAGAHTRVRTQRPRAMELSRGRPVSLAEAVLPVGVILASGAPGVTESDSASPGLFPGQKVAALRARTAKRRLLAWLGR